MKKSTIVLAVWLFIGGLIFLPARAGNKKPVIPEHFTISANTDSLSCTWDKTNNIKVKIKVTDSSGKVLDSNCWLGESGRCSTSGLDDGTTYRINVTPYKEKASSKKDPYTVGETVSFTASTAPLPGRGCYISHYKANFQNIRLYISDEEEIPKNNSVYYQIIRSEHEDMTEPFLSDVPAGKDSYTVNNLSQGKTYWFSVRRYHLKGEKRVYEQSSSGKICRIQTPVETLPVKGDEWDHAAVSMKSMYTDHKRTIIYFKAPVKATKAEAWEYINYWQALYPEYFLMSNIPPYPIVNNGTFTGFSFRKICSFEEASQKAANLNEVIDKIVADTKGKSGKNKVISINNAIREKLSYSDEKEKDFDWGSYSLITGKGTCNGYATAFYACAAKAGVKSAIQVSTTNPMHTWNKVKVDGKWTHIDVCWNDQTGRNKYIWYSAKKIKKVEKHNY